MQVLARIAIAIGAVIPFGCVAGLALASFAESGSFDQYRRPPAMRWHPEAAADPVPVRASDLMVAARDMGDADRY